MKRKEHIDAKNAKTVEDLLQYGGPQVPWQIFPGTSRQIFTETARQIFLEQIFTRCLLRHFLRLRARKSQQ